MRCATCEKFSFSIICKNCQARFYTPIFNKRELSKGFFVYSFYEYSAIKDLLGTKYKFFGDRVFNTLGNLAFKKFASHFEFSSPVEIVPIDDHTRHEFSHTAILAKHLKSKILTPKTNTLRAKNPIQYAGKSLEFRKNNPRDFQYTGGSGKLIILVDDLVTTGTTLLEAKRTIEQNNSTVLFALTLSDAKL